MINLLGIFHEYLVRFCGGSGRGTASNEIGDPTSARKVHKADREKLRRDRLNEQFGELAGVLGNLCHNVILKHPIYMQ